MRLYTSNDTRYRLLRTIIQGIIGVIIANLDIIVGVFHFTPEAKALIVALVMAVLSPVMSSLGTTEMDKPELPDNYWEDSGMEEEEENNE